MNWLRRIFTTHKFYKGKFVKWTCAAGGALVQVDHYTYVISMWDGIVQPEALKEGDHVEIEYHGSSPKNFVDIRILEHRPGEPTCF